MRTRPALPLEIDGVEVEYSAPIGLIVELPTVNVELSVNPEEAEQPVMQFTSRL